MILKNLDKLKSQTGKILSSKYFFWSLFIVTAILAGLSVPQTTYTIDSSVGKILIHGFKNQTISFKMPFMTLWDTFIAYPSQIGRHNILWISTTMLFIGIYGLSFLIGMNSRKRIIAVLSVLIAALINIFTPIHDFEQLMYSFFLILAIERLFYRNKSYNIKSSIMAGLAIGFTYFIRSPLVFLPFLIIFADYFKWKKNFKKYAINSIIFLAASYILLVPWIRVNYFLFHKFIPFEQERATCNIITSVKGSTFTMEGDARSLAGINREESVYKWAAKELLKDPLPFLTAIPKRVLQVFYMYPFLVFLALLVLARKKDENTILALIVPGYFIAIHCLLSVEERYFYPLRYLLSFPASSAVFFLFVFLGGKRSDPHPSDNIMENSSIIEENTFSKGVIFSRICFYSALAAIIAMEIILISYPYRASHELLAINRELKKFPHDHWLCKKKGEMFLKYNMTEEGLKNLEIAGKANPERERELNYILKTLKAKNTAEIENPSIISSNCQLFIVKMLKEIQLNDFAAAKKSFNTAHNIWNKNSNYLRNPISRKDREILKEIKATNRRFWETDIYNMLFYWPIGKRFNLISKLKSLSFLKNYSTYPLCPDKEKGPGAVEFDYNNSAFSCLKEIINHNRFHAYIEDISNFYPLSLIDEIISGEIQRENSKYIIELFHPNISTIDFMELKEIIKLLNSVHDEKSFISQSKQISSLYPNNALYEFISLRSSIGRLARDKRKKAFAQANKHLQTNTRALLKSAWHLAEKGRKQEAGEILKLAEKIKNKSLNDKKDICLILQQLGKYEETLILLKEIIKKDENNSEFYNNRGVVFRFLGKNDSAIKDFKKALKINPAYYQAELNLAALYSLDNKKLARERYQNILSKKNLPSQTVKLVKKEISAIK